MRKAGVRLRLAVVLGVLLCSLILADLLSRNNFISFFPIRCAKPPMGGL